MSTTNVQIYTDKTESRWQNKANNLSFTTVSTYFAIRTKIMPCITIKNNYITLKRKCRVIHTGNINKLNVLATWITCTKGVGCRNAKLEGSLNCMVWPLGTSNILHKVQLTRSLKIIISSSMKQYYFITEM